MLKKIRITLALVFWLGITLLLLDFTGVLHGWLGWMAKVQLLPAVLALNVAVIAALVLLTLLFGRIYCSVICPLGVFQDAVSRIRVNAQRRRRNHKPFHYRKELKWLRYGIWVIFVVALVAGVHVIVSVLAPYSAYGRIVQNFLQPVYIWCNNLFAALAARADSYAFYSREVWLRSLPTFLIAGVTLVAVVILAWTGGRTYCNTVCPVGTTLGFLSRFAAFRPVIDADKCKGCKLCEHGCKASCIDAAAKKIDYSRCVDCFNCLDDCKAGALKYRFAWGKAAGSGDSDRKGRRAFLTATALAAGAALHAQEKKVDGGFATILDKTAPGRETPLVPPGAKGVKDFYRHCTACQLCVAQCPNNVLRPSTDLEHLMQPEMSYERGYCRPECVRCSEVCPTGAIRRIAPEQKTAIRIGLASVDRSRCLPEARGTTCGNCARHCPSGAILMVPLHPEEKDSILIPSVNEALCTGCGACENLCPVRPLSAITVNGRAVHLTLE